MAVSSEGGRMALAGANGERRTGRRRSDRIVCVSPAAQLALDQALAAARSEMAVAISGPPGVGKRFLARAVHAWSDRADGPFVEISCAALPEALQAREILGCAAGVHAALPAEYDGALSQANGGTLLLSRADALRPDVRSSLAQAVARGSFQREGDGRALPVRARLVATSGRSDGGLGDLPHHAILLTALAQRSEDILALAAHFLAECAEENGVAPVGFTEEARAALLAEGWPGNARELRERVRQAIRLAGGGAVTAEALLLASDGSEVPSFKEAKRAFEARYVRVLLRRCDGNISRAARLAKKDRKDFYDVIRRTGIDPTEFRG